MVRNFRPALLALGPTTPLVRLGLLDQGAADDILLADADASLPSLPSLLCHVAFPSVTGLRKATNAKRALKRDQRVIPFERPSFG